DCTSAIECISGSINVRVLHACVHRKSLIKTASLVVAPRPYTSCLPSLDQSNEKRLSAAKLVNCFGGPPSSDWIQRLVTPERMPPSASVNPRVATPERTPPCVTL